MAIDDIIISAFLIASSNVIVGILTLDFFDHYSKINRKTTILNDYAWCMYVGYFMPLILIYITLKANYKSNLK